MKNRMKISFFLLSAVMVLSLVGIQLVQAPTPGLPQNLFRAIEECDNDVTIPENCRINPWWAGNEETENWNTMNEDQYAWFLAGWVYTELELELEVLPQPLKVSLYIDGKAVHLNRHAVGAGNVNCVVDPVFGDCVGPVFRWYTVFEPYHFAPDTYSFYLEYTSFKDPFNTITSPVATLTVLAV
jgi:hypothetical protein